jgi:hypothetical protein
VTRRSARFLTRLYPPAWRARFGAEFQTFLESRHVSPLEALNIAGCALGERVKESWRIALLVMAFAFILTFVAGGSFYLGLDARPHPALWLCWGALNAAAAAMFRTMLPSPAREMRQALRSWRLVWCSVTTLFGCASLLFFRSPWQFAAGMVIISVGSFWRNMVDLSAPSASGPRLAFLLIATAALGSAGWGLVFHGSRADVLSMVIFPLLVAVDALPSARRLFAGQ